MSLTAPVTTGTYSPFWNNLLSPTQGAGGYSMNANAARARSAYRVAKVFNQRGMADARGALAVLIGAAAGPTATVQWRRVQNATSTYGTPPTPADVTAMGGVRAVEVATSINRATTAADVTELKKWFSQALLESGITYITPVGHSLTSGRMQAGGTGRF